MELRPAYPGNAYASDGPKVPWRLSGALDLWSQSEWVAETFGEDVQHHSSNIGRIELEAVGRAITDWERFRGFERGRSCQDRPGRCPRGS